MGDNPEDSNNLEGKRPRIRDPRLNQNTRIGNQHTREEKKLLELYKSLRSEIRTRIQVANRRGTQGLIVLGGIIATAVAQDNFYVLAFVPIVSGLFLANAIISRNEVLTIAYHLCNIEKEISEKGSEFRYEKNHGAGFGSDRSNLLSLPNAESFPNHIRILLYGIAYFVFALILVNYWESPQRIFPSYGDSPTIPSLEIPRSPISESRTIVIGGEKISILIFILTIILVAVVASHGLYRKELQKKFDND